MNMDYCKFENTSKSMQQVMMEIEHRMAYGGEVDVKEIDEFGQPDEGAGEMSSYEKDGLRNILSMALEIVEAAGGIDGIQEAIESF